MKTIVITGPSGSGKSYLSKKLSKIFYNSIVVKTDSYYRDNIIIRFISTFLYDIYDRPFSIMKKKINDTIKSIHNNDQLISLYKYDFTRKKSSLSRKNFNYEVENQYLILEGIFAHRLDLNYKDTINIVCEGEKEVCYKRRLKRDQLERGRNKQDVNKKFNRSWYLFYQNLGNNLNIKNAILVNPFDKVSFNRLLLDLQNKKNN